MSVSDAQKDLLLALKVLDWRAAGASKIVQTTASEDLSLAFLVEMERSCREAADRSTMAFNQLEAEVSQALRQTRVADFAAVGLNKVYSGPLNRANGEIGTAADEDDDDLTPPERLRRETVAAEGRSRNGR